MARPRDERVPEAQGALFPDAELGPSPKQGRGKAPGKTRKKAAGKKSRRGAGAEPSAGDLCPDLFVDVALNRPVRCEFTYRVPRAQASAVQRGVRVAVPFGPRREIGVVVGIAHETSLDPKKLRAIRGVLDSAPVVDDVLLSLTRWMSEYYASSWGEALSTLLPAPLKREGEGRKIVMLSAREGVTEEDLAGLEAKSPKQHKLLRTLMEIDGAIEEREILKRLNLSNAPAHSLFTKGLATRERVALVPDSLISSKVERSRPPELTPAQAGAVDALKERLDAGGFGSFLLFGVTGSGKTEVYLRAIEHALAQGRGAIVLVPEIALTPQTVSWFRARFGDVAVLHSRMTDTQRLAMWRDVLEGRARVVVGARSAIFAPMPKLGVIVVDEEHEPSFKQEKSPRYHARDVALMRARECGAVCILGSATPALESWQAAQNGKHTLLRLPERVGGGRMPRVEIIDMRGEKGHDGGPPLFSRHLRKLIGETLERKEQAILFLNRRGFAPVLFCPACGETVRCHQCDVSLTFHRRIRRIVCHTCSEEIEPPTSCPSCTAPKLVYLGLGSQRVEETLQRLFPSARVARMDSDTMLRREDYETTLDAFGKGDIDLLVGTQMIAKGLDFPRVTLVGIISADSSLHLPDFRASERTYQLLAQVSGRAGRSSLAGRIVIQTVTPEHPVIRAAADNAYEVFAERESELRRELGYPPHGRLVRVVIEDTDEARVSETAVRIAGRLNAETELTILGPAPAPLALLRGRHRQHILVKAPLRGMELAKARSVLLSMVSEASRPRIQIDVDPMGML